MAFALVQGRSLQSNNTVSFTSNVTAGNLLVVGAGCEGTVGAISDTRGNTWVQDGIQNSSSNHLTVWHAIANSSGGCSVTVSMPASFQTIALAEFSGFTSLVVDASASAYNSATPSTVSITNVIASALLVVVVRGFHTANTFTGISGTTLISQANGNDATANGYQIVSSSAARTMGFNIVNGADNSPIICVSYANASVAVQHGVPVGSICPGGGGSGQRAYPV